MFFVQIYLKGVRDLYTWHTSKDLQKGDRVEVLFRNRKKIGIVVEVGNQKPDFKTQEVQRIIHRNFIPSSYIDLAQKIANKHFCSFGKVISLMVPDKFLERINPVQREKVIIPGIKYQVLSIKGAKQKQLIDVLDKNNGRLDYEEALKLVSTATIKNLLGKEVLKIEEGAIKSHISNAKYLNPKTIDLNKAQKTALDQIQKSSKPSLLFGVTGSGKTEIYKKLVTQSKGQSLILVPEIALTSQLIESFQKAFGSKVSVWHSKMSAGEKVQEWARIQSREVEVVIGTRSGVLIPIPDLGLIMVDEEHEWTYKNEFAPRFWAREVIAMMENVKVVYGSATPSTESWYKVKKGEYVLAELTSKFHSDHKPEVQIVDLRQEIKRGNYTPLSQRLVQDMKRVLDKGRQVVLFLNRRGFANITICQHCGYQFECRDCSHYMKLHNEGKLVCHVCGQMDTMPTKCPECDKDNFQWKGWGTQRLELLLEEAFPGKKVLRADRDSVSGKYDFDDLMRRFDRGDGDILLGTQMITKGLDFDKVDLVGIVLADIGLSLPDFRSSERIFQQLIQVAGRTGRREHPGEILVQTFHPDLELFQYVRHQKIAEYLEQSLLERERAGMPPFGHMAKLIISDVSKDKAWIKTQKLYKQLKSKESVFEIHWAPAFWPRTHGKYHFHIFVKGERESPLLAFLKSFDLEGVKVDLNPVSLL